MDQPAGALDAVTMGSSNKSLAAAMTIGGLGGLAWALVIGFGPALRPTNLTWLFNGDYVAYAFGWLFYRSAPWSLPLGQLPNLFVPDGTGVGFTDAIPWLAVAFKPFSALLPESFHYFGLWAVACFVLQGVVGGWLGTRLLRDARAGALVGLLFVVSPPLNSRVGHLALLAHFLVVAAVGLGVLGVGESTPRRRLKQALGLTVIAAGVHPYLVAMVVPLALAIVLRIALVDRRVPAREGLAWLAAVPTVGVATLWLLGYLTGPRETNAADGFGQFSADLLALFNSYNNSRFVPMFAAGPRQYEGYAYLGLGMAAVGLLTLGRIVAWRPTRATLLGLLPVTLTCAAMFFYALSNHVTLAGKPVADLSSLYAPFVGLTTALRSSGRFIWPLHALVVWVGVGSLRALASRPLLRLGVLTSALALQVADVKPSSLDTHEQPPLQAVLLQDPAWATIGADYRHLALYPFQLQWVCRYDNTQVVRFGYEAQRRGLTFNSGLIGRVAKDVPSRCDAHQATFDEQTIYVANDPQFLVDLFRAGLACGALDGYPVCVTPTRQTPLLQAVLQHPLR